MNLKTVNISGKTGELAVSPAVFGAKPNTDLLAQAVHVYLSNQRQGTSKVKTRGEINRTKKKWYKQKGTGNARHGARSPSIFVGGGVAFGPTNNRDWTRTLSKKQRVMSMIYALSLQAEHFVVADELMALDGKTKSAAQLVAKVVPGAERVLVVLDKPNELVIRSIANISNVLVTNTDRINVYEVLLADKVLTTKDAITALEKKFTAVAKVAKVEAPKAAPKKATVAKAVKPAKVIKEAKPVVEKKPAVKRAAAAKTKKKEV